MWPKLLDPTSLFAEANSDINFSFNAASLKLKCFRYKRQKDKKLIKLKTNINKINEKN